jgi:hypothetical protein
MSISEARSMKYGLKKQKGGVKPVGMAGCPDGGDIWALVIV